MFNSSDKFDLGWILAWILYFISMCIGVYLDQGVSVIVIIIIFFPVDVY